MSDELVERLLDWPYQGETMAEEAAVLIKQLTAERDGLRYERDAILLDGTVHSDQREKYERLCARIAAGKASQQDAVDAIRQLCRDNERLALRRSDARADAEKDNAWAALWDILACETPNANATVTRMVAIAKAALKGESHE